MNTTIRNLLIISILFNVIAFLGSTPPSARGFYYVIWLSLFAYTWKKRDVLTSYFTKSRLGEFPTFILLGICMILIEETFAGLTVNILSSASVTQLLLSVPQYYANNFLTLPGFIIAWYFLAKRYAYTRKEIFILVGFFGLFAEKIYIHLITIPIMGVTLTLPTMFTYMAIIAPSLFSLRSQGTKVLPSYIRYPLGFIFPIIISIPFILIHSFFTKLGWVDPSVLGK